MEPQEILQELVFVLLYGGVIMLNVVAALYLLLRRGNAIAPEVTSPVRLRRWAAAFMVASALSHIYWPLYAYHPTSTVYVLVCGLDMLVLFPTIAGVLLSMLQDQHRVVWPVVVLLIPAFVMMSLSLIRGDESLYTLITLYVFALYALLILYVFFAVRQYRRWLRDNYADLENKEIWQSLLILAVFLLFFVMYSSTTESAHILAYLLQIDCIIIVVLLLWRVETLQQLSENTPLEAEPAEDAQNTSVQQAIPSSIGPLLKKQCEEGQLYLQHDLTLAQLAQTIGTNRYYLSQHFAQQGLTYNAYINGLRVKHFVRLYHEAVADQRIFTAQQLAFESGFHSYSTFSATFKQNMGMPVTRWMRDAEE
ncbi:MAG: helix-turn-helix transcriptional regulator [Bacteroidales bacterium]|nr:helix-turn-helix transcriptional regulator [Bacteroidales bacterium]